MRAVDVAGRDVALLVVVAAVPVAGGVMLLFMITVTVVMAVVVSVLVAVRDVRLVFGAVTRGMALRGVVARVVMRMRGVLVVLLVLVVRGAVPVRRVLLARLSRRNVFLALARLAPGSEVSTVADSAATRRV